MLQANSTFFRLVRVSGSFLIVVMLSISLSSGRPGLLMADSDILVDGVFGDWAGRANLTDPAGDADKERGDLATFYWANNNDQEFNYWMIERYPDDIKKVTYTVFVDTDDDGNFDENGDRQVIVDYNPRKTDSIVQVQVKTGDGETTISNVSGDWGETESEGGLRVEFQVSFAALGINFGDVVRMYVESDQEDRLPDSGDIQWSPASVLGYWLLGVVLAGGAVALWGIRRKKEKSCPSG
jgi:hypothetical protein